MWYAMSGTDIGYGATRDLGVRSTSLSTAWYATSLCACYDMSGTDMAYDATSCPVPTSRSMLRAIRS
eukprot:1377193-Rhodomonas_salina.1